MKGLHTAVQSVKFLSLKRGGDVAIDCPMTEGRDFWYDTVSAECSTECPA